MQAEGEERFVAVATGGFGGVAGVQDGAEAAVAVGDGAAGLLREQGYCFVEGCGGAADQAAVVLVGADPELLLGPGG